MKVDIASRHNRSFFGLNVQYIKNGSLQLRTLAVKELFDSHTSTYLTQIVKEILSKFDLDLDKIYSFTSDNGRNMVKLGELIQKENSAEEEEEEEAEIENEEDDELRERVIEDDIEFSITSLVRCTVHTLQLAILDVINDPSIRGTISKVKLQL